MTQTSKLAIRLLASAAFTAMLFSGLPANAASHREAPSIAMDPSADNTDVYAFVSYDQANLSRAPDARRATFIMNVNPGQDPADGPNYFNFDDHVLYTMNIDNQQTGVANNITYEFSFTTATRPVGGPGGVTGPLPYIGNPRITPSLPLRGITALDGAGSVVSQFEIRSR